MKQTMHNLLREHLFVILLTILGFAVFFNSLFNGFVWDDITYILQNSQVHTINLFTAFRASMFNSGGQYRPIPALYFAILYQLFTTSPFFYHFLSVALHIINAILVFYFFSRFFIKRLSFFLALIFLVHPIQVESVTYIAAAGSPLFFLFGMGALLLGTQKKLTTRKGIFFSLLLLLSLLSKEAGVLFFAIIFLFVFFFNRKLLRQVFLYEIVSFFVYCIIRFAYAGIFLTKLPLAPIAQTTLAQRLLTLPFVFSYYLQTFFRPGKLAIDQQWIVKQVNLSQLFLPLLIMYIFVAALYFLGRFTSLKKNGNKKAYVFFVLWFGVGISLYLQIFPLDMTVADRWFYFPIVGMLGIFGVLLTVYTNSLIRLKNVLYIAAVLYIAFLSVRTIIRNFDWIDPLRLYLHDSTIQTSFDLENNIGGEYFSKGNFIYAYAHYKISNRLLTTEGNSYNLCNTALQLGLVDEAKKYCYLAFHSPTYLSSIPGHTELVYERLAQVLLIQDSASEAKTILFQGLHAYPQSGNLWALDAVCLYNLGDSQNALAALSNAKKYHTVLNTDKILQDIQNNNPIQLKL